VPGGGARAFNLVGACRRGQRARPGDGRYSGPRRPVPQRNVDKAFEPVVVVAVVAGLVALFFQNRP